MKNIILLIAVVLGITFTSCKKVYNYSTPNVGTLADVNSSTNENYSHTTDYINQHNWKIVGTYGADNGNVLIWKLQAVDEKTSNNFLIIDKADPTLFWNPNYQLGAVIIGSLVSHFNIKKL